MPKLRRHKRPGDEVSVLIQRIKEQVSKEVADKAEEAHRAEIRAIRSSHRQQVANLEGSLKEAQAEITRLQGNLAVMSEKLLKATMQDSSTLENSLTVSDPHPEAGHHEFLKWIADHKNRHLKTAGLGVDFSAVAQSKIYRIAPGICISFAHNDSRVKEIDGDLEFLFSRLAQRLLEAVLLNKRGTLIYDPVAYRKDIGVFKTGGTALDATKIAARLSHN